jgi:hypothetical protein
MTRRSWRAAPLALLLAGGVSLLTDHAWAFCRATTCNPETANCPRDADTCTEAGAPLYWASSCLTLSVQSDGSPSQGIDYEATVGVVQRALDAWTSVDCAGKGAPSIRAEISDAVECRKSELNDDGRNANIVMFREDDWPYVGAEDAFALTRVRFGADSGQIWDVDIELNATEEKALSVGDPVQGDDLDSIMTHEVGHLLGLDHTLDADATMFARYVSGDDSLRTLEADDIAGICAMYPPNRNATTASCEQRGGFSPLCGADQPPEPSDDPKNPPTDDEPGGCSLSRPRAPVGSPLRVGASLVVSLFLLARRSRRRRGGSPIFEY